MPNSYVFNHAVLVGGRTIQATTTLTYANSFDTEFPALGATADQLIPASIPFAQIRGVFILADQNLTLETNSTSSPANTFALLAGIPLEWHSGMYHVCPFTANITAFYVTNADPLQTLLRIKILHGA